MSKSEWVKQYMADNGCSHQAAYKAWAKLQPATEGATMQPDATDYATRLAALEAQVDRLESEVKALKSKPPLIQMPRERVEVLDAVGPSKGSKQGKIEMPKMLPHKRWD